MARVKHDFTKSCPACQLRIVRLERVVEESRAFLDICFDNYEVRAAVPAPISLIAALSELDLAAL